MLKISLCLDLGNSATKAAVRVFDTNTNQFISKNELFKLDNRFCKVDTGYVLPPDYPAKTGDELDNTVLNVTGSYITSTGTTRSITGCYVNGYIVENEAAPSYEIIDPDNFDKKQDKESTYLSVRLGVGEVLKRIKAAGYPTNDLEWSMMVLLPPQDADENTKNLVIRNLVNLGAIDIPSHAICETVSFTNLGVSAEGQMAFFDLLFNDDLKLNLAPCKVNEAVVSYAELLLHNTIMVIDIGAGTTDGLIIQNGKINPSSKTTFQNLGGNDIASNVMQLLANKKTLTFAQAQQVVNTGVFKKGIQTFDAVAEVNTAKSNFVNLLNSYLNQIYKQARLRPEDVAAILIVGGGCIKPTNPNILSLGDLLHPLITKRCESTVIIELPSSLYVSTDSEGKQTTQRVQKDVRYMNVCGLMKFARQKKGFI